VLEALRQPLEEGRVVVSRTAGSAAFPARFQLVGAANPCRRGCPSFRACTCSPAERAHYLSRLSRPLLDRIDLHLEVPAVPFADIRSATGDGADSAGLRRQVETVRARQRERFPDDPLMLNGRMDGKRIRQHCPLDAAGEALLKMAVEELGLSLRAHDRILRVARTIADLAGAAAIADEHLAEAIQLRSLDRKLWSR
jgi:magnesium chelatase family protein